MQADKQSDTPALKLDNLLTVLTAVLNFEFGHMLAAQPSKDPDQIGTFTEAGEYKVTSKEIQNLHRKF